VDCKNVTSSAHKQNWISHLLGKSRWGCCDANLMTLYRISRFIPFSLGGVNYMSNSGVCLHAGLVGESSSQSLCSINLSSQRGSGDVNTSIFHCASSRYSFRYVCGSCFGLDTGACMFFNVFEVRNINRTTDQPRRMVVWRETELFIQDSLSMWNLSAGFISQASALLQAGTFWFLSVHKLCVASVHTFIMMSKYLWCVS
jgi:hypothetical protein